MNSNERWWKNSIGYIIYPESFLDTNGDGYGDLNGITQKLDYLHDLGINLIWICPLFLSPMCDSGYDVSDYYNINPLLGTMDDFMNLLNKAHSLGIRIILDFPINHTSDEHPWFELAIKDENCEERGYYFFKKGKLNNGKVVPPNNWESFFGGSVWEKVKGKEDEYYFHLFDKKMPDVNWGDEQLRKKYYEIATFWLDKGIDGFRLDACAHLAKDISFRDSMNNSDEQGLVLDTSCYSCREELFSYLHEFKESVFSRYNALILGEVGGEITPEIGLKLTHRKYGVLDMLFNFDTVWNNGAFESIDKKDEEIKTDVLSLKSNFMRWYNICHEDADLPLYWCNHDHPRLLSQYGDVRFRNESAKMLLTTLLFLYGTPFIYQGEEIGMSNPTSLSLKDYSKGDQTNELEIKIWKDKGYSEEQILHYFRRCNRLNSRTPIPWNSDKHAGFSSVEPYLPIDSNYSSGINILSEMEDPYSILNFYQYAIWKRRDPLINDSVIYGKLSLINPNHPDVFAYLHSGAAGQKLMVISNFRPYEVKFTFYYDISDVLLHNYDGVILDNHVFTLRPYESFLLRLR